MYKPSSIFTLHRAWSLWQQEKYLFFVVGVTTSYGMTWNKQMHNLYLNWTTAPPWNKNICPWLCRQIITRTGYNFLLTMANTNVQDNYFFFFLFVPITLNPIETKIGLIQLFIIILWGKWIISLFYIWKLEKCDNLLWKIHFQGIKIENF